MKTLMVFLHIGGHGASSGMLLFLLLICAVVALLSKSGSRTNSNKENLYTDKEVDDLMNEYKRGFQEGPEKSKEKN